MESVRLFREMYSVSIRHNNVARQHNRLSILLFSQIMAKTKSNKKQEKEKKKKTAYFCHLFGEVIALIILFKKTVKFKVDLSITV